MAAHHEKTRLWASTPATGRAAATDPRRRRQPPCIRHGHGRRGDPVALLGDALSDPATLGGLIDKLRADGLLPTLANVSDAQIERMREYIARVVRPHDAHHSNDCVSIMCGSLLR